MHFNLDYDSTFTGDPILWWNWAYTAHKRDHKIYCISQRTDNEKNRLELRLALPPIVELHLTSHTAKKQYAADHSIKIDVWIEDNPIAIFESDRHDVMPHVSEEQS